MNIEGWRSQAESSQYPFAEDTNLVSNNGLVIPNGFLVDAQLFVPAGSTTAWLSTLTIVGDSIVGIISTENGPLGTFSAISSTMAGSVAAVLDANGLTVGTVVFGQKSASIFLTMALGSNIFQSAQFESSCVFRRPPCVQNILVADQPYPGKIALVEGIGIRLVVLDDQTLRVDGVGDAEQLDRCCEQPADGGLLTINEVAPDKGGDFQFVLAPFSEPSSNTDLRQVLRISPTTNGLIFSLAK